MALGDAPVYALTAPFLFSQFETYYIQQPYEAIVFNDPASENTIIGNPIIQSLEINVTSELNSWSGYSGPREAEADDLDGSIRTFSISGTHAGDLSKINYFNSHMMAYHCGEQSARFPIYFIQRYLNQFPAQYYVDGLGCPCPSKPSVWSEDTNFGFVARVIIGGYRASYEEASKSLKFSIEMTETFDDVLIDY